MIFKKYIASLLLFSSIILTHAQDYDEIGEDRRLHRRRRPQYGGGGGGPCGRDADGRFLSLQYVNYNYHVNCGGGGGHAPQQDFLGGGGLGGGHRPQKPHKPHRPIFGGGGGGHGGSGNGGGFLGSHGGGGNGGLFGSHGGGSNGGGLFGSHGGGLGGLFQGNRPQTIVQDAVSGIGDALNRPPFNQGGGNGGGGGIFGSGLFDGSIINSFTSLFSNSDTNRPPSNDNNVQFIQDMINTNNDNDNNNNNNDNTDTLIDEKPVHEDHDEIPEVYTNKLRRGEYVPGSPSYGNYHNPGYGYGGGYGGFNYNKAIKKVNRQINTALKPIYQLFRR